MEVEVVLREVGEDRRGDVDAVRPPQLERVRGDLHRAGAIAAVEHLAERALEVDRLGRGADGRPLVARDHRGHGPEQAGLAPGRLQQRADEERRRGLAVGPRDTNYGQPGGGVPVEARGGDRHRGADVLDLHLRHAEVERPGDDERRRAAFDRVGREIVAVAREPGDAEEQGPGLHGTVVVGQAADLDRRPIAEQLSDGHPRAVYERPRTIRSTAMPRRGRSRWPPPPRGGRDDDRPVRPRRARRRADGRPVRPRARSSAPRPPARCSPSCRAGGSPPTRRSAASCWRRAATFRRHGHLYSYDLRRNRPASWDAPPGIRLTDINRPVAELDRLRGWRPIRRTIPITCSCPRTRQASSTLRDGGEFGPLLRGSGLAVRRRRGGRRASFSPRSPATRRATARGSSTCGATRRSRASAGRCCSGRWCWRRSTRSACSSPRATTRRAGRYEWLGFGLVVSSIVVQL